MKNETKKAASKAIRRRGLKTNSKNLKEKDEKEDEVMESCVSVRRK